MNMHSSTSPSANRLHDRFQKAVESATAAPSSHNTQPWKFRILQDRIELYADRSRRLPIVDPMDRALTISCGAALDHLCLAMHCDGLSTMVRVLPDPVNPDLLARVIVRGPHVPSDNERMMYEAIPRRRTNRSPFEQEPIDPQVKRDWLHDAAEHQCWLEMNEAKAEQHEIANLIDYGDRMQASNKAFRHELAQWVHSNNSPRTDGMPGHSHGFGDLASRFGRIMIRTFDWGNGQAAKDRQLAEGSPMLAVMGTNEDTPQAWLACGQALSKMLLRGTAHGLDASFLNQPIEVASLRFQLAELINDDGFPQILLRWGKGKPVNPTPRRPVKDVLI